jgi:hypothetical protein
VRSDLPCDRKKILEFKNIESICIEILVGNKKWLISGVYRPQTKHFIITITDDPSPC